MTLNKVNRVNYFQEFLLQNTQKILLKSDNYCNTII